MRNILYILIASFSLAGCVSNGSAQGTTPASGSTADGAPTKTCHEEAVTGSNMTRTVCRDTRASQDDKDQQMRDMSGAHNSAGGGGGK